MLHDASTNIETLNNIKLYAKLSIAHAQLNKLETYKAPNSLAALPSWRMKDEFIMSIAQSLPPKRAVDADAPQNVASLAPDSQADHDWPPGTVRIKDRKFSNPTTLPRHCN